MGWYKKAFGSAYLEVYSHRDEREAGKALKIIQRACLPLQAERGDRPLRILDLCCGPGRYGSLLAGLGHEVAGVDLSEELLRRAAAKSAETPAGSGKLWLVRADMREVPFHRAFDMAINMFTSFGYFSEDEENLKTLRALNSALRTGGRFVIDYLNREQVLRTLVGRDSFEQEGLTVTQSRRISPDGLRVDKSVQVQGPRGGESWIESVRLYSPEEMRRMLSESGLETEETFGNYDAEAHGPDSPRLILTGRLRD